MDRKIKERLIGLIVLLTAAIIILPMILGGPDDGGERTVQLDRDRAGDNLPVTRLDLREPDDQRSGSTRSADSRDNDTVVERPEVRPFEPVEESPESEPETESEAEPEPRPAPESEPEPRQDEAGIPEGSGWTAQVGSFSDRDNAEGLTRQLRDQGFDAFVMRHERNGSTFYRVRVGLEPEREDAQRIARRIKERTGHEASTVPHP